LQVLSAGFIKVEKDHFSLDQKPYYYAGDTSTLIMLKMHATKMNALSPE
jgi:hypothetical protein